MAKAVRKPPGPADYKDQRAMEYFHIGLHEQNSLVGERTFDLASIASGAQVGFTITVNGAKANKAHTVEYGLPSNWNTSLQVSSVFVSADDTVTIVIRNPTGGAIDQASGLYGVRVRP